MKKSTITKLCAAIALFGVNATSFAQTTTSFSYTGSPQTYTVAAGVSYLIVDMEGATGGQPNGSGVGGAGGRLRCMIAVTPGSVLQVNVAGKGDDFLVLTTRAGGFNGGGDGYSYGAGGGGASDLRMGGTALVNRVAVAAGGGGGGFNCANEDGGCGGGLTGGNGKTCGTDDGMGGTQTAGGAGGGTSPTGMAGVLGVGGDCATSAYGGGGGGGGYYGGGGGSQYGGGGGGSSYADTTVCTAIVLDSCYNTTGNGRMMIRDSVVASTLGVASVNGNGSMSVYPNPSNGTLNIKWQGQQASIADVVVADMTGRVVFKTKLNITVAAAAQQVDMKRLDNGMYMISVKSPTINYSSKLMIQK